MAANHQPGALAAIASAVVAGDPQLRDRVRAIVDGILRDTEYVLKWGTRDERTALSRSLTPGLIRALQSAEAGAQGAAHAVAHERLRGALREGLHVRQGNA
jgi:hypothetical protein